MKQVLEQLTGARLQHISLDGENSEITLRLQEDRDWQYGKPEPMRSVAVLMDRANTCCGRRFISTDDQLGAGRYREKIVSITIEKGPETHDPDRDHSVEYQETAFLVIKTTQRTFTFVTHNEHNGYYGGFDLNATIYDTTEGDVEVWRSHDEDDAS